MSKNPTQQKPVRAKRRETARIIAELSGYSIRHVQMVMNGDRDNESILEASIMYEQENSRLIQEIKSTVPFNK